MTLEIILYSVGEVCLHLALIYNKEQHKVHYGADTVSKKLSHVTYEEESYSPDEPESLSGLSQDCMVKVKSTSRGMESSKAGGSQNLV